MRQSTIAKHLQGGSGTAFAIALGEEIRRRRLALGLSQADLGEPLSRSFVSQVEHGRLTPSLLSLLLIASRLGITGAALLAAAEGQPSGRAV